LACRWCCCPARRHWYLPRIRGRRPARRRPDRRSASAKGATRPWPSAPRSRSAPSSPSRYPGMLPSPHADPARGVFAPILVLHGRPVELDAHLERLAASLDALFEAEPPSDVRELVLDRARNIRHGRLRLTVVPEKGRLRAEATATEVETSHVFPSPDRG